MYGRGGVTVSVAGVLVAVAVLNGQPPRAAAQFIVTQSADSTCPTNRYFLSPLGDVQSAYAPYSGEYISTGDITSGHLIYWHEYGHSSLRNYTSNSYGIAKQTWFIEGGDSPAFLVPAQPAAGPVVKGDPASPPAYLRVPSLSGAGWQLWSAGDWVDTSTRVPGEAAASTCGAGVRLRCVSEAWRCPAGRLHVAGLPVGDMTPATLGGSLLGAAQSTFGEEPASDDDPAVTVDAPLLAYSDMETADDTNELHLGTFLMTSEVHMNRPVYRHAGRGDFTFLYFDHLKMYGSEPAPLWIIGPQPSKVNLGESRLFFVVDSAVKPEEITGCWQYLTGGRQGSAYLNVTCEHGRMPPGPLNGADCDFELPGACGYRATEGRLRQQPYSDDELSAVSLLAGNASPDRFFARLTAPGGGRVEVLSQPFEAAANSCISFDYRMRTDAFFTCQFSLVSEADGARRAIFTMSSAARDWMRIQRSVTAGRYRLEARADELAEGDGLQLDSVRVTPGACGQYTPYSPCSRQPCANGGTCVPTGDTTYTCLCRRQQFQGRDCRPTPPCPEPPRVEHAGAVVVPPLKDVLPTARYYCKPEFELEAPLIRSVATCLDGQWRGAPTCRRRGQEEEEEEKPGGAAGRASSAAVTAVVALVVLAAFRVVQ